jgi:hypothetical protein
MNGKHGVNTRKDIHDTRQAQRISKQIFNSTLALLLVISLSIPVGVMALPVVIFGDEVSSEGVLIDSGTQLGGVGGDVSGVLTGEETRDGSNLADGEDTGGTTSDSEDELGAQGTSGFTPLEYTPVDGVATITDFAADFATAAADDNVTKIIVTVTTWDQLVIASLEDKVSKIIFGNDIKRDLGAVNEAHDVIIDHKVEIDGAGFTLDTDVTNTALSSANRNNANRRAGIYIIGQGSITEVEVPDDWDDTAVDDDGDDATESENDEDDSEGDEGDAGDGSDAGKADDKDHDMKFIPVSTKELYIHDVNVVRTQAVNYPFIQWTSQINSSASSYPGTISGLNERAGINAGAADWIIKIENINSTNAGGANGVASGGLVQASDSRVEVTGSVRWVTANASGEVGAVSRSRAFTAAGKSTDVYFESKSDVVDVKPSRNDVRKFTDFIVEEGASVEIYNTHTGYFRYSSAIQINDGSSNNVPTIAVLDEGSELYAHSTGYMDGNQGGTVVIIGVNGKIQVEQGSKLKVISEATNNATTNNNRGMSALLSQVRNMNFVIKDEGTEALFESYGNYNNAQGTIRFRSAQYQTFTVTDNAQLSIL